MGLRSYNQIFNILVDHFINGHISVALKEELGGKIVNLQMQRVWHTHTIYDGSMVEVFFNSSVLVYPLPTFTTLFKKKKKLT